VSDDFGRDYPGDDPFVDPNDPEAVEREARRREREAKRREKAAKKAGKQAAAPPPPAPKPTPPAAPRTPEQEFWDEPAEPAPPVPGQEPPLPKADPEKAEKGRRRLFGRRKGKEATAGAAAGAAAAGGPAPAATSPAGGPAPAQAATPPTGAPAPARGATPPTGPPATPPSPAASPSPSAPAESQSPTTSPSAPAAQPSGPPTSEEQVPKVPPPAPGGPSAPPTGEQAIPAGPPTAEQPLPGPSRTTGEEALPKAPPPATGESDAPSAPATGEEPMPNEPRQPDEDPQPPVVPGPPSAETPLPDAGPPIAETPFPATAEAPRPDPGPGTAEAPRPDPNQAIARGAVPGDAGGPTTREHRAPLPLPVEPIGAGDWEPPPPRDGDDWFDEFDDDDDHLHEGDPAMAGAARHGRRHGEDGGRRGGFFGSLLRHPFRIFAVIVLIVILLFVNALFQPFHGDGSGRVVVDIPKGSSVGEVGDLLEKKGVISDGFVISGSTFFQARVSLSGDRSNLIAGKHVLEKDMSYGDAIDALTEEPKARQQAKPGVVTVTIPEGQSRPITAKLVKEDGIKGNYLKATKKSKILNPAEYGGKGAKNLEGFLFPDTWELKTKQPVSHLVALQLEDFKKKIKKVHMKYAKSKNLTVFDVVTIASMIEREAGVPKQRKLVASVIYNRLHEGMTLGIDSTIRFATGNYEKPLTESELESESPYNTRTHAGLPPGPINSPGLAALNAAVHPAKTDFLFYVNNPNSCNELTFAKTEEEFLADAAKYEKAREANGGNQPTTCK
jgi:UPF0755 protein